MRRLLESTFACLLLTAMPADSGAQPALDVTHGTLAANGIEIHYVEQGEGPLVVMLHGFPESWYSWRHQIPTLAEAGYRAVALDMRGYGQTSQPEAIEAYALNHIIGDVVGAVAALGETQAVVVGHDWGGPVAWNAALMRPDVFRAVAVLSVPYSPPTPLPPGFTLNALMAQAAGDRDYYRLYFQEPGVAEADLEADIRRSLLGILYSISGDIVRDGIHEDGWAGYFPKGESFSEQLVVPERLPAWLTEEDLAFYVGEMTSSGFRGGLNWYRNINRLPGVVAPFLGATVRQPALYIYGEHDRIAGNSEDALARQASALPDLRRVVRLDGAGHWIQQERPADVNEALLAFLSSLDR